MRSLFRRSRFCLAVTAGRAALVAGLTLGTLASAEEPVAEKPKSQGAVSALFSALGLSGSTTAAAAATGEAATHKQTAEIVIRTSDGKGTLQTFCVGPDENLYAVVTAPVPYGAGVQAGRKAVGEIHVYSPEGKKLRHWVLDFEPQRIAAAASGELYVGGSGKLVKFDAHGKQLAAVESPHLAAVLADKEKLLRDAEEQRKQMVETYANATKQMEEVRNQLIEQKKQLEKKSVNGKPAAKKGETPATDSEEDMVEVLPLLGRGGNTPAALDRQIKQYDQILKSYMQQVEQQKKRKVEDIVQEISGRLQRIHAISVGEQDMYIATAMSKGYGYAVWRMGLDFSGAEQIVQGLSGCCGQMDIQARGDELFVAENSRHRVLKYSREGKKLAQFGSRERAGGGFGGCCNPMNLCFTSEGNVLTAESEGKVRCFTADGKYEGLCGTAKVSGGCKNVAVGMSKDGQHIFFYDLQGSKIVVMTRQEQAAGASDAKEKVGGN